MLQKLNEQATDLRSGRVTSEFDISFARILTLAKGLWAISSEIHSYLVPPF